eukprot:scaffold284427_cov22-Tisochrysis_lutea.AAC.2
MSDYMPSTCMCMQCGFSLVARTAAGERKSYARSSHLKHYIKDSSRMSDMPELGHLFRVIS